MIEPRRQRHLNFIQANQAYDRQPHLARPLRIPPLGCLTRDANTLKSTVPGTNRFPTLSNVDTPRADCTACAHCDTVLAAGRCEPGDRCLIAHSGRQIERFLRTNPEFAEACLQDAFWERRAIAVRYAPVEAVRSLAHDTDEAVRRAVVTRLPPDELMAFIGDSDREVRITVASKLPAERLHLMLGDTDYLVRQHVAQRIPHGSLSRLVHDEDREVRKEVARRLPSFVLSKMAGDEDPEVRAIAAARMLPDDAARMLDDPDWRVRLGAVERAPLEAIRASVGDEDKDVREQVWARLNPMRTKDTT